MFISCRVVCLASCFDLFNINTKMFKLYLKLSICNDYTRLGGLTPTLQHQQYDEGNVSK